VHELLVRIASAAAEYASRSVAPADSFIADDHELDGLQKSLVRTPCLQLPMTEDISTRECTWIWKSSGQIWAVVVDTGTGLLQWHQGLGSKCGDDGADFLQSADEFLKRGAPFSQVPPADLREIRAQLYRSASATNEH